MNFLQTLINQYNMDRYFPVLRVHSVFHSILARESYASPPAAEELSIVSRALRSCYKLHGTGEKGESLVPTPRKERKMITFETKMENE